MLRNEVAFAPRRSHCRAIHQTHAHQTWPCSRAFTTECALHESLSPAERFRQARTPAVRAVGAAPHAEGVGAAAAATAGPDSKEQQLGPQVAALSYRESPEVARAAVENIAAAFKDDPSTTYFCRPEQRVQFYRSVLNCLLDWYPDDKQLVCTLPPDAAAFVYVYPRLRELGAWTKLMRGGLAPLGCVQLGRLVAGMDASDFFEGQREDFLKAHGPFMYVSVMAVRPGRQGCGLGSSLLTFICDRADAAGLHCYIEATSPRNRVLYERFGFQMIQAWRAKPEMPYTYILSRPPHALDPAATPADAVPAAVAADVVSAPTESDVAMATAVAPPLWWQPGAQLRRQRFAERRQQQRLQQQGRAGSSGSRGARKVVSYIDLDEYGWWPLRTSEPGAASTAESDVEATSSAVAAVAVAPVAAVASADARSDQLSSWGNSSSSAGSSSSSDDASSGVGLWGGAERSAADSSQHSGGNSGGGERGGGWLRWSDSASRTKFGSGSVDAGDGGDSDGGGGGGHSGGDGGDGGDFD